MYFAKLLSILRACTFTLDRRSWLMAQPLWLRLGRFEARLVMMLRSKVRTWHRSHPYGPGGEVLLQGATRWGSQVEGGWGGKNRLRLEKSLQGVERLLLRFLVMVMVMVMREEMGLVVVVLHGNPVVTQSVLRGLGHSLQYSHASADASLSLHELLEGWAGLLRLLLILLMPSATGTWQGHNHIPTNFPERLSSGSSCLPFTWRASRSHVSSC